MGRLRGCLGLIVIGIILYVISSILPPTPKAQVVPANPGFVTFTPSPISGDFKRPTANLTPSPTITDTAEPPTATSTTEAVQPTGGPTSFAVTERAPASYYVRSIANARVCPDVSCPSLGKFQQGDTLVADGITRGGAFQGNEWWYRTNFNGQVAYVNTALTIESELVSQPQPTQVQSQVQAPVSVPVQQSDSAICNGATTCDQMVSCAQAYACLRAGNSRLDGEGDGVPCEKICPGG